MQIKDFPEKDAAAASDLLLLQDADNLAYRSITKQNLLAGLNSTSDIDPIQSMPNLSADWCVDNAVIEANNLISSIPDSSGNNYHAIQNNDTNKAILISNCLSNHSIARFSGSQFYTHNNLTEPATIIAVIKNLGSSHRTLLGAISNPSK